MVTKWAEISTLFDRVCFVSWVHNMTTISFKHFTMLCWVYEKFNSLAFCVHQIIVLQNKQRQKFGFGSREEVVEWEEREINWKLWHVPVCTLWWSSTLENAWNCFTPRHKISYTDNMVYEPITLVIYPFHASFSRSVGRSEMRIEIPLHNKKHELIKWKFNWRCIMHFMFPYFKVLCIFTVVRAFDDFMPWEIFVDDGKIQNSPLNWIIPHIIHILCTWIKEKEQQGSKQKIQDWEWGREWI